MHIVDILTPERILCHVEASSKKRVLEFFGKLLATDVHKVSDHKISDREVYEGLIARERLGSTSVGKGVAIPHARVHNCDVTLGAFLHLDKGVDYDAIDRQPVDLLFALMVPEHCTQEHLDLMAILAQMFSDEQLRQQLRTVPDCEEKFRLLIEWEALHN
jgi:nitrogen PTS system EIIA component